MTLERSSDRPEGLPLVLNGGAEGQTLTNPELGFLTKLLLHTGLRAEETSLGENSSVRSFKQSARGPPEKRRLRPQTDPDEDLDSATPRLTTSLVSLSSYFPGVEWGGLKSLKRLGGRTK